jgi:uncharacterized protein (TIGR02147 family)
MKLPNIKKYKSTKDFFEAIYELNKKEKKIFSYRYFANQLGWPVSYLNDVVKGRKKTTLTRAIQFSQKFKLSTYQTEYLIFLCLAESEKGDISQYFVDKIDATSLKKEKNSSMVTLQKTYHHPIYNVLYILIEWGQGKLTIDELATMQTSFPELHDKKIQKEAVDNLLKKKIIKKMAPNTYDLNIQTDFAIDDVSYLNAEESKQELAKHIILNLNNLIKLYQNFTGRSIFFSSFINIPMERAPEVVDRFHSFRDWMINLAKEEKSSNLKDHESFQLEMHLVPIFDSKKL